MEKIYYDEIENKLSLQNKKMSDLYRYVGYSKQSNTNFKKQGYIPVKFASEIANFLGVSLESILKNNTNKPTDIIINSRMFHEKIPQKYKIKVSSTEMHPKIQINDTCYCIYNKEQLIEDNTIVHYNFKDKNGIRIIKVDENTNQISLVPLNMEEHKIITIPSKDSHLLKRAKITTITRNL